MAHTIADHRPECFNLAIEALGTGVALADLPCGCALKAVLVASEREGTSEEVILRFRLEAADGP